MSECTFIASDYPLIEVEPSEDYPLDINFDDGMIYDGGTDDNYYLSIFTDVEDYTEKRNAVYLEWSYTEGRAKQIIEYIKDALQNTDPIELWHVWLMGSCYEFEDSPVIHRRTIFISELTTKHIKDIDNANIWNSPDKMFPNRPSFYCIETKR